MVGSSPSWELPESDSSSAALQMALSPQRSTSSSPPSLVLLTKRPSSARSRYGILGGECVYPLRSPAAASLDGVMLQQLAVLTLTRGECGASMVMEPRCESSGVITPFA